MNKRTLINIMESAAEKFPDNICIWEKKDKVYEGFKYREVHEKIQMFAAGLISTGLNKGDRSALISEGRMDWVIAELGVLYAGAINVPISIKVDELSELKFRLAHSGCKFAIVSGRQLKKVLQIKNELPDLKKIIVMDPVEEKNEDILIFTDIFESGKKYLENNKSKFEEIWKSVQEDDPANISYTSGTTADPKGIILTHRNYTANVEQSLKTLYIPEWYCLLLILPWDHAFAHTAGIYTVFSNGASLAVVQTGKTAIESLKNIPLNIKETRPTFLFSVPAIARNFRNNIERNIREKGPFTEKLFKNALKIAYKYNGIGYDKGKGWWKILKPLYALYDIILFKKIREAFGGRLEFFIGGGALLDIELQRFFYAIGIPMFQGYGLTEAAPVISANTPEFHKLGSSGKIIPDLDIRICDDKGNDLPIGGKGEIVVRGENVMAGYWKNEKATNDTIRNGWLYTGDLGFMDSDGYLYLLGREKSLLISNDGEKYSPEGIEDSIVDSSQYISQLVLYNNQSPYTVALLVPKRDALLRYLKSKNLSLKEESGKIETLKLLENEIAIYRKGGVKEGIFPGKWLPAAIGVLSEEFTEQNHLLNSTMKIVRGKIVAAYKDRLEYLFTAEAKDICNKMNLESIAKFDS
jgi:long-chain acyl-CoA synthetase